jgi:Lar family restriction alleviation protein
MTAEQTRKAALAKSLEAQARVKRENELLPCPFCGGSSVIVHKPTCTKLTPYNPADRAFPTVRCGCGANVWGDDWDQSAKTAIAAWNRRATGATP